MMKKYIILFLLVLFNCTFAFASDYNVYKFNNGQTVIIKQVKTNPIVIIDTWVKTGSINENDENTGISHFLEHLFFKGTKTNKTGEFDRILESKGAVTNAATSKDFTHYYIKIPSKDFDLALNLHADMLLNPEIPQKELEKERKVVLEEIAKDKNSPSDIVYDNLNELIFKVHPYKRQVIGKDRVIKTVSREKILDYYYKHYSTENMITVIVGDIEPDEAAKKVEKAFNTSKRKLEKHKYQKEPKITQKRVKQVNADSNVAYMMIGFRGTKAVHKDEFALDVLSSILGDGKTSRFYKNIVDKKQLTTSISASNMSLRDDGVFFINTKFKPENKYNLEKAIFGEIKNIQKNGVSEEELNVAKNIIERNTYYSRESISNIASEMGYTVVLTGNPKDYDKYLNGIASVNVKDIKRVANKYLNENQSAVSVVMPENYEAKIIENSKKTNNSHKAVLNKTAYNTDKYTLDNGSVLLVNENKTNDIIAMSIMAKGGDFLENKIGTSLLTSNTMLKGTKKYSKTELAQILEENGINISVDSGADFFEISVLTTKKQLPVTMELLNEIVNNAIFDESEIEKAKKNILNTIKTRRDIPLNRAIEEYKTYIFEDSVYSNSSKIVEKTLNTVQKGDIISYYNKIFYPKNLVISVNGDVNKQDMINKFSEMFNQNNGKVFNYSEYKNILKTRNDKKIIKTDIKDLQTGWLILGWQTSGCSPENIKEFATLQVINSFIGTGMSSRLFRHLREAQGLAYQIGSSYSANVLKGSYMLYIGTNPVNLESAKKQMLQEITTLKREFVSEKELQEAKDKLTGKFTLALETNIDKASALALYELSGRGFDFVENYPKLIQSVTASDIIEVANKYFNDNYVESVVDKAK